MQLNKMTTRRWHLINYLVWREVVWGLITLEESFNGNGPMGQPGPPWTHLETRMELLDGPQLYDLPMKISLQDCIAFIIAPACHVNAVSLRQIIRHSDCICFALAVTLASAMCRSRGLLPKLRTYQPQSRNLRHLHHLRHLRQQRSFNALKPSRNMLSAADDSLPARAFPSCTFPSGRSPRRQRNQRRPRRQRKEGAIEKTKETGTALETEGGSCTRCLIVA